MGTINCKGWANSVEGCRLLGDLETSCKGLYRLTATLEIASKGNQCRTCSRGVTCAYVGIGVGETAYFPKGRRHFVDTEEKSLFYQAVKLESTWIGKASPPTHPCPKQELMWNNSGEDEFFHTKEGKLVFKKIWGIILSFSHLFRFSVLN